MGIGCGGGCGCPHPEDMGIGCGCPHPEDMGIGCGCPHPEDIGIGGGAGCEGAGWLQPLDICIIRAPPPLPQPPICIEFPQLLPAVSMTSVFSACLGMSLLANPTVDTNATMAIIWNF